MHLLQVLPVAQQIVLRFFFAEVTRATRRFVLGQVVEPAVSAMHGFRFSPRRMGDTLGFFVDAALDGLPFLVGRLVVAAFRRCAVLVDGN